MRRTVEARTDRLLLRRDPAWAAYPAEAYRKSLRWQMIALNVAFADLWRAVHPGVYRLVRWLVGG